MRIVTASAPVVLLVTLLVLPSALPADPPRAKPINLAINTDADEDDPHISSDGRTLYYAANAKGKWDLMFAQRRNVTSPWGKGVILQDYIQTEVDDRSLCVTAEGRYPQYIYYATKTDKAGKNFDLYVAVKQGRDRAFAEPRALTTVDTPADEMHPWLTTDGKELYFSRKTKEGWRVYVTRRANTTGPAGWGREDLVEDLEPGFHHVTLTSDGKTMYLQGPLEKDRWGLFVVKREGKKWGKPEALDMLNDPDAPTGDRSPALTRDGNRLYFASDRAGGKGGLDLWVVDTTALTIKKGP
jgi:Tol biopolymer transport system component